MLDRLTEDGRFPRHFLPLVTLNCLSFDKGCTLPRHLHLFGLNSRQIIEFSSAFMEFGIQKRQLHLLQHKLSTCWDGEASDRFIGLSMASELDFVSFARYWCDFQNSLIQAAERHSDLGLTAKSFVFFGHRSLDELIKRSYAICLMHDYLTTNSH